MIVPPPWLLSFFRCAAAAFVVAFFLATPVGSQIPLIAWQQVLPIIRAIAVFLDKLDPTDSSAISPLNGFLAGLLLAFDPTTAANLNATYRIDIDGRRFDFAVEHGQPDVTVTASAAGLITTRLSEDATTRQHALHRIGFDGDSHAVEAMRTAFSLHENQEISLAGQPR